MWNNNTIEDEIQRNSLEYGIAVNSDRAIPDAKSGLKPVARRIIYDMINNGYTHNKPHVKSAKVYGDVMGRFHPHGDSSIYGAMVRLSQDWVMRYPLIDPHGNFGNIMGDGPAAGRYTEVRLSKIAEDGLTKGLKKNNVDFIPTYDESETEPITLPAIFPNLLCNPNEGIGWAMGCSWAPHNLREVSESINQYLDGMEPTLPGPDFPTGGIIINKDDIPAIMRTGHGSVKIRGKYNIEKQNIVFYELPYGTRLEALMEQIGKACDEGKVTDVIDIRNETGKKGIRLVIEVDKNISPEVIVKQLFAKTDLQTSFSYNQVALIGKTPTELNLKQAIEVYINHNIECMVREARFDMLKAMDRLHIVEGLLKALEDIDNIIKLIKASASAAAAKEELIKKYSFTEIQAKAILDMKLAKLANLEKVELQNEKAELNKTIEELDAFINNDNLQKAELRTRLAEIVKKFGDDRRTELAQIDIPKDKEEKKIAEVVPVDCVVVTAQTGYVKRIPTAAFKVQHRGGKGVKSQDDTLLDVVKTNTQDYMMFFSNKGKLYRSIVNNIPEGNNTTKGTHITSLIKMEKDEQIVAVSSLHRKTTPKYCIFLTKNGMIKKSFLEEYMKTNRNTGVQAIKLGDNDEVVDIIFQDEEDIVVITKLGMGIKFKTDTINPVGRVAMGVKAIKLAEGDELVAGLPIHKTTDKLALFAEDGFGKKLDLSELSIQGRGGKGVIVYKDKIVVGAAMISDEDNILICGTKNIVIPAKEISEMGKTAQGITLIKSGKIKSITKI